MKLIFHSALKRLVITAFFIQFSFSSFATDLEYWHDTAHRQTIINFVSDVTDPNSKNFVSIPDRIAVFDNDGTLWTEYPMYNCSGQVYFLIDMLNKMAPDHPEWQKQQPFASLLKKGPEALKDVGLSGAFDALAGIYSNQPISDIQVNAQQFLKKEHPAHKIPFSETTYLPMVELISYLQKNQFKVFIVSGGTLGFMRAFTNDIYNVPNEQVIGKRPIIAVGNSDGDIEMLTYATEADGIQLGLLVNHDDELREGLGGHVERAHSLARSNSEWIIISIKTDFKKVFTDKTN